MILQLLNLIKILKVGKFVIEYLTTEKKFNKRNLKPVLINAISKIFFELIFSYGWFFKSDEYKFE